MKAGVVGAGILGRMLAVQLIQNGWSVSLFDDQSDSANCSMTAAGLLTPLTELEKNDALIFTLGMDSLYQHWPIFLGQWPSGCYFQMTGSLVVAHPRDGAELQRFVTAIAAKLKSLAENSMGKTAYYRAVSSVDLEKLEPELVKLAPAYYFPDEGNLDNQTLLQILGNYLQSNLEKWHSAVTVQATAPGVVHCHQQHHFDVVFDCRGLGAKEHFPQLRGVRGELFWLHAPQVNIHRPVRLLNPRYSLYIAPRPNNIYVIGASEIESEDRSPISARTLLELLSTACYLHSGFAEARVIKTMTHLRPTLSDNLPKIKFHPQLIAINGLYRHGFLIAPALIADVFRYLHEGSRACHYPTLWEPFHANIFQ